jgi:general secretion pathway protein J
MPARRAARPPTGFTLVEVLVALVIMAVMAAMGWQGVAGMVRAKDIGQAASERTLRLSTVLAQFEQDLLAIYDSPTLPGFKREGANLRLLRRLDNGVQVVVWALREGRWQRWASPITSNAAQLGQAYQRSQLLLGTEAEQLLLIDGVTDLQLTVWNGTGWSNAESSGELVVAKPATSTAPLPSKSSSASGSDGSTGDGNAGSGGSKTGGPIGVSTADAAARSRVALPPGVRLQLDLPEGRIVRILALAPQLTN